MGCYLLFSLSWLHAQTNNNMFKTTSLAFYNIEIKISITIIVLHYTEKKSSLNFLELFQDSGMRANVEQIFYILYNFADLM